MSMPHNGPIFRPSRPLTIQGFIDLLAADSEGNHFRLAGYDYGIEGEETTTTWLRIDDWWVGVFVHEDTNLEPTDRGDIVFDRFEFEPSSADYTEDMVRAAFEKLKTEHAGGPIYVASIRDGIDEMLFAFDTELERDRFAEFAESHGFMPTAHTISTLDKLDAASDFIAQRSR